MMKSVAVHVHPLIVAGKNLVFKFLNEMQTSKINFIGDQDPALLDEVFGLANLERKYGGQLPDQRGAFWPPVTNLQIQTEL